IGERRGPVDAKLIERAGGGEHLQRTLVDEARIDGAGEFGDVLEAAALRSLGANVVDGVAADIAQRRKRIADGAVARHKACLGAVHRRRLDANAHAASFLEAARNSIGWLALR